jgi:hypothetical protein
MDSPFLFPQSRIFRAYNLTADLNMRYGADIRFISAKLRYLCFSQYIGTWVIFGFLSWYAKCWLNKISYFASTSNIFKAFHIPPISTLPSIQPLAKF